MLGSIQKWFSQFGITEHRLFLAGVLLKALDGLLELAAGIIAFSLGLKYIKHAAWLWASNEIAEEPGNLVAQHLATDAKHISPHTETFAAIYLILHGALKLGLVAGMLRKIHWAYPATACLLIAFIGYQIYRIVEHFSFVLVFLTCLDALIVLLILLEFARLRSHAKAHHTR